MRLEVSFIEDHIEKKLSKSDHFERSFLGQNLSKISAKMDNFLIFEEKSHSSDNKKILQNKKIPTYRLGFVGPCGQKHTFFFALSFAFKTEQQ